MGEVALQVPPYGFCTLQVRIVAHGPESRRGIFIQSASYMLKLRSRVDPFVQGTGTHVTLQRERTVGAGRFLYPSHSVRDRSRPQAAGYYRTLGKLSSGSVERADWPTDIHERSRLAFDCWLTLTVSARARSVAAVAAGSGPMLGLSRTPR
ncbi:hypothetical protein FHS01_002056 [Longimicrobium terrae]|nr:hypothetical protein [Longimicrobium terrae]